MGQNWISQLNEVEILQFFQIFGSENKMLQNEWYVDFQLGHDIKEQKIDYLEYEHSNLGTFALNAIGEILQLNDDSRASEYYLKSIANDSLKVNYRPILNLILIKNFEEYDNEKLKTQIYDLLESFPNRSILIFESILLLLQECKDIEAAQNIFIRKIDLLRQTPDLMNFLRASLNYSKGELFDSENAISEVICMSCFEPDYSSIYSGILYFTERNQLLFKKIESTEIDNDNPDVRYFLARIDYDSGEFIKCHSLILQDLNNSVNLDVISLYVKVCMKLNYQANAIIYLNNLEIQKFSIDEQRDIFGYLCILYEQIGNTSKFKETFKYFCYVLGGSADYINYLKEL